MLNLNSHEERVMSKKVSVIIPSYGTNTDPCRAIDSVLNQDYPNVDVYLVDDNGAGTEQQRKNAAVLKKYADNPRVHYLIHDVNKGGSVARNTGARASDGDYLCFLDDDDELADATKISKQMNASENLGPDWAGTYSSLKIFNGDRFLRMIPATNSGYVLEEFILGDMSIGTAAPVITRLSFDTIGGFEESFKRHQDWEFYCRLMDRFKLKAVPEAYYHRYYKTDVKRKTAETRRGYMDKYVSFMKQQLKSLPQEKIELLMKRKYVSVIFAFLREKQYGKAREICRDNGYRFADYLYLIKEAGIYVKKKLLKEM